MKIKVKKVLSEQKWNKDSNTPRDYSKEYNPPGSQEQDERNKRKRDKRKHDKEHGECPDNQELHHVDGIEGDDLQCEPVSKNRGRKEKSRLKDGEIVIKIKKSSCGELNEGVVEKWWNVIKSDIASVFTGGKPVYTIDLLLSKIRQTDKVKNLKGNSLVTFLQGLQKIQPKTKNMEQAHGRRQLDNIINYAKNNPTMIFEDIIESGDIKHARTPQEKEIVTSFGNLANLLGTAGSLYAQYQEMDPTMAENKKKNGCS